MGPLPEVGYRGPNVSNEFPVLVRYPHTSIKASLICSIKITFEHVAAKIGRHSKMPGMAEETR
jgi:hypothetical protein